MRWITFIILLYLAAGLWSAQLFGFPHAGSFLASPRIEYVAILVIFYSLFGDEGQAPIFALAAGAALDFMSEGMVLGTQTMALGLMSVGIVKIRLSIFREQMVSQAVITFLAVMAFALGVAILHELFTPGFVATGTTRPATQLGETGGHMGFWRYLSFMCGNALYSGVVAPPIYWVFLKMRGMMGIAVQTKRGR